MRSQNLQVLHFKSQQNHHEITVLKSKNIIFPCFLIYTGYLMIFGTQKPWVTSTKALVNHRASARDQQLRVSAPGQVGSILEIWTTG